MTAVRQRDIGDTRPEKRLVLNAEMERRLKARSISVIVYDEVMPLQYRTLDFIHFTQQGHAIIAAALLPRVTEMLDRQRGEMMSSRIRHASPR